MSKLQVFISSIQNELSTERLAIVEMACEDSFLRENVEIVRFEEFPAETKPVIKGYLDKLDRCDVYLGIIGHTYGMKGKDGLSATHREYNRAVQTGKEILIYIKGTNESQRDQETLELIRIISNPETGHKYKSFRNYRELKKEVRASLLFILKKRGITPTRDQNTDFENSLQASSDFDITLSRIALQEVVPELIELFVTRVNDDSKTITEVIKIETLSGFGMVDYNPELNQYFLSNAGALLFARNPERSFPQIRICLDVYPDEFAPDPEESDNAEGPLPKTVEKASNFLQDKMRKTYRIIGFKRVLVYEYPISALREAVVNAVAHRDYAITGATVKIEKYPDKIQILSPGLLPPPLTLQKIRTRRYRPISRNPFIARGLSYFEDIEEKGRGIKRMHKQCLDHGLKAPAFDYSDGYFVVTFYVPESMDQVRVPQDAPSIEIAPSVIDELNERQREMVKIILTQGRLTTKECILRFDVVRDTVVRDFQKLIKLNIVEKVGKGRSLYYQLKSSINKN